jgi:hypothetical protein
MSFLQARGDASQYEHAQEQATAYKLLTNRTKIFALQIAEYMNMTPEAADNYAQNILGVYIETCDDHLLLDRVLDDLQSIGVSEHRSVLEKYLRQADDQADAAFY